jgi:uncharacterized membrane protein YtjA (UPF0391 family)
MPIIDSTAGTAQIAQGLFLVFLIPMLILMVIQLIRWWLT